VRLAEDRPEDVEVLTEDECRWLLARAHVGWVGFTVQALPAIVPVRFAVDAGRVVIPVLPDSGQRAPARSASHLGAYPPAATRAPAAPTWAPEGAQATLTGDEPACHS
jgi:hypothetical protein